MRSILSNEMYSFFLRRVIIFALKPAFSLSWEFVIFLIVVIVAPQYLDSVHTDGRPTDLVMTFSVAGGKILILT